MFFDRLAQHDRIVSVSNIELTVVKPSGTRPRLKMKGTATTYRFRSLSGGGG